MTGLGDLRPKEDAMRVRDYLFRGGVEGKYFYNQGGSVKPGRNSIYQITSIQGDTEGMDVGLNFIDIESSHTEVKASATVLNRLVLDREVEDLEGKLREIFEKARK